MAEENGDDEPPAPPRGEELVKPVVAEIATTAASTADGVIPAATLQSLDAQFHAIAQRLASRDRWPRNEFDALAREHQLMPLSVFDGINEWSDQQLGDFLLEGEDSITVHRALLNS
ncbi:hypothetical protein SDC9_139016 [bioreactor metagenome]|uniref:TerB-C domain-containing protein n=1 Tax=bioreactor metagenome TaxID=1076179 RepID=A0A645DTW8_9ZZZZ